MLVNKSEFHSLFSPQLKLNNRSHELLELDEGHVVHKIIGVMDFEKRPPSTRMS